MVTLANELQSAKADGPISVTESGMVTLDNDLQPAKASSSIWVTESDMVTLANELHPAKAPFQIRVTESGMITLAKVLQFSNAPGLISVALLGIRTTNRHSKSISWPHWANSSLSEHVTVFCLKIAVTCDSGESPASAAVSLFVSNLLAPTTMSTRVVSRVSSSSQSWQSLIRSLSS